VRLTDVVEQLQQQQQQQQQQRQLEHKHVVRSLAWARGKKDNYNNPAAGKKEKLKLPKWGRGGGNTNEGARTAHLPSSPLLLSPV